MLQKPLDQLPFAVMKARYRAWLAERKLNDENPDEEALKKVCEIFRNIST